MKSKPAVSNLDDNHTDFQIDELTKLLNKKTTLELSPHLIVPTEDSGDHSYLEFTAMDHSNIQDENLMKWNNEINKRFNLLTTIQEHHNKTTQTDSNDISSTQRQIQECSSKNSTSKPRDPKSAKTGTKSILNHDINQYRTTQTIPSISDTNTSEDSDKVSNDYENTENNQMSKSPNQSSDIDSDDDTDECDISHNSDEDHDDFDMNHHKETISQINSHTANVQSLRKRYEDQLNDSKNIILMLKQISAKMNQLNEKMINNMEHPHSQTPIPTIKQYNPDNVTTLHDCDINDITNPMDITDNTKEIKGMTIFKLNATQLDALQSITTPLNIPRFQELREKYETCLNQIRTFLIQVESMRGKYLDRDLQNTINEIKEAVKNLKQKEKDLESELNSLANKKSNIHNKLPMPAKYGTIDNPSQEGHMPDYDSVPKFIPNSPNSRFEVTWHNLIRAAGSRLSQEGYKQILGCKLFVDSASYFNLYKDRPLEQLVTILANRFCSDKSTDQYLQEIESFQRPPGQSLTKTLECLKFLILSAYQNKPKEEQATIMNSTIRRAMPRLVSREVLKKIFEEEKRHDNTGTHFDFEHSALTNDDLEKKLPKTDISSEITTGLHQMGTDTQLNATNAAVPMSKDETGAVRYGNTNQPHI